MNSLEKQIGGTHYLNLEMQPIELIVQSKLNFIQGCIIKYITRYEQKNGLQDIQKCIHYANLAIELNSIGPDLSSIGLGYTYCRVNKMSTLQTNIVISAMLNNYYSMIRYCNQIIKKQYGEKALINAF